MTADKSIAVVLVAGLASAASAQSILSYDILDAAESGFGGWAHQYDGAIENTGSGSANGFAFDRADYSEGSGTLNDGSPGNNASDTQLFANNSQADPRITVFLDDTYTIDDITLFSFDGGNTIPGRIQSVDVTINGVTVNFKTDEFTFGDEFIEVGGSELDGLATSSVTFSNFGHDGGNNLPEMFCIGEIEINGQPADGCPADLDGDDDADADDFFAYLDAFAAGDLAVCDLDQDDDCDADDFFAYLDLFAQGC